MSQTQRFSSRRNQGASAFYPLKVSAAPAIGALPLVFSRSGTATVRDHESRVRLAKSGELRFNGARRIENRFTGHSEDLTNAAWTTLAGATTRTWVAAESATRYVGTSNSGIKQSITTTGGETGAISFYVKTDQTTNKTFRLYLNNGVFSSNFTATSSWQLFEFTGTLGSGATEAGITRDSSGNDVNILVKGAQFQVISGEGNQVSGERVSVGVTSAPEYHGAFVDGVKYFPTLNQNTSSSGIVTEVSGTNASDTLTNPIAALIEPSAATNLALWSRDMTNAAWVKTNITPSLTQIGNDGKTNKCCSLTATAANATILQTVTGSSALRTYSVDLKRFSGTGNIQITADNGTTWTTVTGLSTQFFTRYEVAATMANPVFGIRVVTSGDAVTADFSQLEAGGAASSPIETTSATVTRAADSITLPDTAYSDTAGMVVVEAQTPYQASASSQQIVGKFIRAQAADIDSNDGTNTITATSATLANRRPIATAWGNSATRLVAGVGNVATGSYDGGWNGTGQTILGGASGVPMKIRNLSVYRTKPNSTQQDDAVKALSDNFVIFDGDSITEGWNLTTAQTYAYKATVALGTRWQNYINSGTSGETLANMESDAATDVDTYLNTSLNRNVVCMMGGINDFKVFQTSAQVKARMQTYWNSRIAAGWTRRLAIGILPWPTVTNLGTTYLDETIWNEFLDWMAAQVGTLYTAFLDPRTIPEMGYWGANLTSYWQVDNQHPSVAGAALLATYVAAKIPTA